MTATPMPAEDPLQSPEEELRWAVETELAWHDGDAKAAIADLIKDRQFLRQQLELSDFAGSKGFSRGWRPSYERHE